MRDWNILFAPSVMNGRKTDTRDLWKKNVGGVEVPVGLMVSHGPHSSVNQSHREKEVCLNPIFFPVPSLSNEEKEVSVLNRIPIHHTPSSFLILSLSVSPTNIVR